MKAEINNENKATFFAQYWGQEIHCNDEIGFIEMPISSVIFTEGIKKSDYTLLKPLSSISDEDLNAILPIVQQTSYHRFETNVRMARQVLKTYLNKESTIHGVHWWEIQDVLRFRGYAIDWLGLTVDEMVEAGWIKLTQL